MITSTNNVIKHMQTLLYSIYVKWSLLKHNTHQFYLTMITHWILSVSTIVEDQVMFVWKPLPWQLHASGSWSYIQLIINEQSFMHGIVVLDATASHGAVTHHASEQPISCSTVSIQCRHALFTRRLYVNGKIDQTPVVWWQWCSKLKLALHVLV